MVLLKRKKKTTVKATKRRAPNKAAPKKNVKAAKRQPRMQINEKQLDQWVKERAYFIWEERGKPTDQEHNIWTQAEKDIMDKAGR